MKTLFSTTICLSGLIARLLAEESTSNISSGEISPEGWVTHDVRSNLQAGPTQIRVLQPNVVGSNQKCTVLYVLPVEAGRESKFGDGLAEVKRCDLHNKHGLICVAPTFAHLPWYADHPTAPLIRQEKYFVEQVVPFIERAYPVGTRLENRWLLGFSKSGWGAWSLIARHPELFGRAAAWDAPLEMAKFDRFRAGQVFGSQSHFESYRVIPALQKVDWSAQTVRGPRLILTGYDAFREHHESAHRLLDEQKIPHIYRDGPKRKHIWESGWVEESVELLVRSEHE